MQLWNCRYCMTYNDGAGRTACRDGRYKRSFVVLLRRMEKGGGGRVHSHEQRFMLQNKDGWGLVESGGEGTAF